jgi:hypothetical protein
MQFQVHAVPTLNCQQQWGAHEQFGIAFHVLFGIKNKGGFFCNFSFYKRYSTLLHLPPLKFHCVGGCGDRTQDSCDYGINCQEF